jgi:hypothetical protein
MLLREGKSEQERIYVPKKLCQTRWSAHADAVKSLASHYGNYIKVFQTLSSNTEQNHDVRSEAKSILNSLEKLETAIMLGLWNTILQRTNETSKRLQSETIDLGLAVTLLKSLADFVRQQRDRFDDFRNAAALLCGTPNFTEKRKRVLARRDDSGEHDVLFDASEQFRIQSFIVIIDLFSRNLDDRISAYKAIDSCFHFLTSTDAEKTASSLKKVIDMYPDDLTTNLVDEWTQWCSFIKHSSSAESGKDKDRSLKMSNLFM